MRLHSFARVMEASALREAEAADREIAAGRRRGPLHGVPVAVKDLCDTAGVVTAVGTRVMADRVPSRDATVVSRLRGAGAVILGKLAMTEGAYSDHHPDIPAPVNPWSADLWPGVSSSGSGVATAAGLCFAGLGSDTGGSIRLPSAMNSLVGIKPTYGRVPLTGVVPMAASLDHVGPLARSVLDAAIVLDAIAGFDPDDATSASEPPDDCTAAARACRAGLKGTTVGFDARACEGLDDDLVALVEKAVDTLAGLGAKVKSIRLPALLDVLGAWSLLCGAEMLVAHERFYPQKADDYGPGLRMFLDLSSAIPARELARAGLARFEILGRLQRVFQDCDVIACPTLGVRVAAGVSVADPDGLVLLAKATRFTAPFNVSRNPCVALPCGRAADGFPASLQLVGRHWAEATIVRIAAAYEAATPWHEQHPSL
jgi:amidase